MTLTKAAERAKERTTASLHADALADRMLGLAQAVTQCPQGFTPHHEAQLRNACQVALAAADLINLEWSKTHERNS